MAGTLEEMGNQARVWLSGATAARKGPKSLEEDFGGNLTADSSCPSGDTCGGRAPRPLTRFYVC